MNTRYFCNVETAEELKRAYRKAAFRWHPDQPNGDAEIMKKVNEEYSKLFELLKNTHKSRDGKTYQHTGERQTKEAPETFINIINELMKMHGLTIEIIGAFIWITGETKQHKDSLKKLGFKWHSKKEAWYLAPDWYRKSSNRKTTLEECRQWYHVYYTAETGDAPKEDQQQRETVKQIAH